MKIRLTLLVFVLIAGEVFATAAFAQQAPAASQETQPAKKAATRQGRVIRIDNDQSMIELRGGSANSVMKVAYDSDTQWTTKGQRIQRNDVKEGSFVTVLGEVDAQGVLHATRIDLRPGQ